MEIISPITSTGTRMMRNDLPLARITIISLSVIMRPRHIRNPTRVAKGADWATMNGREYPMSRTTSMRGTRFFSTSSAIKRIWFTKKTIKKKRNAMKKYSSSSFIRYVMRT